MVTLIFPGETGKTMGIVKGCVLESEKENFCNNTDTALIGRQCAEHAGGLPNPTYCYVCNHYLCNEKNPQKPVGHLNYEK